MFIKNLVLENARIIFRNFSGKPGQYNPQGKRTFAVILSKEDADRLSEEGWNVKSLRPREEGDEPTPYLPVTVKFREDDTRNPKIYTVFRRKKTPLTESTVGMLDFAEIDQCDLIISPYKWEMNGREGVTAYLKTMYATIIEEDFGGKYDFDEEDGSYEEVVPW